MLMGNLNEEILISRQAVLDLAYTIKTDDYSDNQLLDIVEIDDIKALPSVNPQPKIGHWNLFHTTEHGMREDSYFKCNRCNYESYKEYNFCPDCGARMEVEQNG